MSIIVPGRPSQPDALDTSQTWIFIQWSPAKESLDGYEITDYDLSVTQVDNEENNVTKVGKEPEPVMTYNITWLAPGVSYEIKVRM